MADKKLQKISERLEKLEERVARIEKLIVPPEMDSRGEDELLDEAVKVVRGYQRASASLIQRMLGIGYARAVRILDQLENKGYVGPAVASQPRVVLIQQEKEKKKS